jgi:hypothetical protein
MASKGQMTGMLGVYLVAAELSRRDFIVSVTSRSAAGADLLITDQKCKKAWSVQVKTNRKPANFWLLNPNVAMIGHDSDDEYDSHMYVFVNIRSPKQPDEFIVVPSRHVHKHICKEVAKTGAIWYSFLRSDRITESSGWELFGEGSISSSASTNPQTAPSPAP